MGRGHGQGEPTVLAGGTNRCSSDKTIIVSAMDKRVVDVNESLRKLPSITPSTIILEEGKGVL